ncbi:MAG: rRNA maturation RNase YbeY [Pseudomonadota bacterium]
MSVRVDLRIDDANWERALGDPAPLCEAAILAGAAETRADGEIDLLLCGDGEMHALNKRFRGKDKPTNVLSFPADPIDAPSLGSIAIAYGVTADEASAAGKPLAAHLSHLLVHGFLHLVGHDHESDEDAALMEGKERSALARLGLPDPYSF